MIRNEQRRERFGSSISLTSAKKRGFRDLTSVVSRIRMQLVHLGVDDDPGKMFGVCTSQDIGHHNAAKTHERHLQAQ